MADYHVLEGTPDGNSFRVVFHLSVPDVNNRVGVNVRTALVNSGVGGSTILPTGTTGGTIRAAELTQVQAGAVFEVVETIHTNPSENAGKLRSRLDNRHSELQGKFNSWLQSRLSYYGYERTLS
jgi:hypothetical protein